MTVTYSFADGDQVVYTDGVCFIDSKDINRLPGIANLNIGSEKSSKSFSLTEGWWWVPPSYRICVYTGHEIMSDGFLDITKRINIMGGNFIRLEEELRLPPYSPGMQEEIYYDIWIVDEEGIINILRDDLSIIDSGNLIQWKNKIQIIDILYA